MRAAAQAPGMFAALAEGLLPGDLPFSVACPVDSYARAEVSLHEKDPGEPPPPEPTPPQNERVAAILAALAQNAAAVERTLTHLARPDLDAHTFIGESIPQTGTLGHGSAERTAAIAAAALALGQNLPPETIAEIALSAAPTAGVMLPGLAILDHYGGQILETLGPPPPMELVALDFGAAGIPADTTPDDYRRRWQSQQETGAAALALLRQGIANADPSLIGQAATLTAHAAAAAYPELAAGWRLDEAANFARHIGAAGILAGRGPVGILLDATQRRGKSAYRRAADAFPHNLTLSHYRVLAGGVRPA